MCCLQVNSLIDYYVHTESIGVLEVLVKVASPHDKHIFDKLSDLMRDRDKRIHRLAALSLFGSIVRSGPTWLYKITTHNLLKDILKLLKQEKDIVLLISALLSIVALLPIVPSSMGPFLPELFEVFSHLAAWNSSDNIQRLNDEQLIHLQIGFYFLFHRLYGMYPCNFIDYIRSTYLIKDRATIFQHTIRPLLETVKVHPLLITASKDSETSTARWKKMEPHDIVNECARLSLEYADHSQTFRSSDCTPRYITPIRPTASLGLNVQEIKHISQITLTSFAPVELPSLTNKLDSIWSPSNVVLATPPPTALSHTSTPTPNLQQYQFSAVHVNTADGYSPPETAIEATPETTPMKTTVKSMASVPPNSTIARAIRNTAPTGDQSTSSSFRFTDHPGLGGASGGGGTESSVTKQKLMKIMLERSSSQMYMGDVSTTASPANLEFDGSQEDQEVRVINSRPVNIERREQDLDETLTNIDFEHQGSPCGEGGLHLAGSGSVYGLAQRVSRLRLVSNCFDDSFSAGTSPDSQGIMLPPKKSSRQRRYNSWPNLGLSRHDVRSPSDFRAKEDNNEGSKKDANKKKLSPKICQQIKKDLSTKTMTLLREDKQVQTNSVRQPYDKILSEVFEDELKVRNLNQTQMKQTVSPNDLLEKLIELSSKRQRSTNAADDYKESLRLLHLQLQYERYRREVHADRNRRLMGISRQIHQYEQNLDTLNEQNKNMSTYLQSLQDQLNNATQQHKIRENEREKEKNLLENRFKQEHEENQRLRALVESLQTQLEESVKTKKESHIELEAAKGDIFDLQTELSQMMLKVEIAQQYKDELARLQSEVTLMGEIQLKCREKFASIELMDAKDEKIERLTDSFTEEVRNLRCQLESKGAQLDTAKARLAELESLVSGRDSKYDTLKIQMMKNQNEYEDKIKALEKKYVAQKAVVLRLEEHILELLKNRSPTVQSALSPDSEMAGSLEHVSPLSQSQTSSDISSSLKSITEIRNLQEIALHGGDQTTATVSSTQSMDIPTSSRATNN